MWWLGLVVVGFVGGFAIVVGGGAIVVFGGFVGSSFGVRW